MSILTPDTIKIRFAGYGAVRAFSGSTPSGYSSTPIIPPPPQPPTITLSGPTLSAPIDVAYSSTVTASGGTAPYTFAVTVGSLPTGLTLASSGNITGTPTAFGAFPFTITATDTNNYTGTKSATLTVSPSTITLHTPTSSVVAESLYSSNVTASGGVAPYTYSITSGSLPSGITLFANGAIGGTSNVVSSNSATIHAVDSQGSNASITFTISVSAPTVTVSGPSVLSTVVDVPYSDSIIVNGGIGPYVYANTSTLPTGLSLDSANGAITGTPTVFGSFPLAFKVTDVNGFFGTKSATLSISSSSIVLNTPILSVVAESPYSSNVYASGGVSPYTYTITSGSLPSDITLSSNGEISGTSNAVSSSATTVKATDSQGSNSSITFTISVSAPTINVIPPTLSGAINILYSSSVTANGGVAPYTFNITSGTLPNGVTLASDGSITGTPLQFGTYPLTVKATDTYSFNGSASFTLSIAQSNIILGAPTPLSLVVGTPYSSAVTVSSGGVGPYSFGLTSGSLPSGLTLNADGTIVGTPDTPSTNTSATVTATDSQNSTASITFVYDVAAAIPALSLASNFSPQPSNLTLTAGVNGQLIEGSYSYNPWFYAENGTAPYSYSITGGSLPSGYSLGINSNPLPPSGNGGAYVVGIPTTPGTYTFNVTTTDFTGNTASNGVFEIVIDAPVINLSSLPSAKANQFYNNQITVSGTGSSPYTFANTGALPDGLALDSANGTVSGTPGVLGVYNFDVVATDSYSFTGNASYSISVTSSVSSGKYWLAQIGDLVTYANTNYFNSITTDANSNLYVLGSALAGGNALLSIYDTKGTLTSQYTLVDQTGSSSGEGIVVDSGANAIISVISSYALLPGGSYLAKVDPSGNLVWQNLTTGVSNQFFYSDVALDSQGNSYVIGYEYAALPTIIKFDPNGNVIWQNKFDIDANVSSTWSYDSLNYDLGKMDLAISGSDLFVTFPLSRGYPTVYTAKIDTSTGAMIWSKIFSDARLSDVTLTYLTSFITNSVVVDTSNVYVIGQQYTANGYNNTTSNTQSFVLKYDTNGNLIYSKTLFDPGANSDTTFSGVTDSNNNLYLSGTLYVTSNSSWSILQLDPTGNINWQNALSGNNAVQSGLSHNYDNLGHKDITVVDSETIAVTGLSANAVYAGMYNPPNPGTNGVLYFDGSSYLNLSPGIDIGAGPYTIEGWFYFNDVANNQGFLGSTGLDIKYDTTTYGVGNPQIDIGTIKYGTYSYNYSAGLYVGTWVYLTFARDSSGNENIWFNGSASGTQTDNQNLGIIAQIGANGTGSLLLNGAYVSDLRISNTNLYDPTQNDITVPNTFPLTSGPNTVFLINTTDANTTFVDASGNQTIANVGNPSWQPTVIPYATYHYPTIATTLQAPSNGAIIDLGTEWTLSPTNLQITNANDAPYLVPIYDISGSGIVTFTSNNSQNTQLTGPTVPGASYWLTIAPATLNTSLYVSNTF
jgi:hypothetical protein